MPTLSGGVGASFSAVLGNCGRFEESAAFAREAIAALRGVAEGTHWFKGMLANNGAEALLALGRWDKAAALLDEVTPRDRFGVARLGRAQLHVARGDLAAAERDLEAVRHLQRRDTPNEGLSYDETLVELRLWQNRPAEALAEVRDLLTLLRPDSVKECCRLLCVLGLRAAAELAADGRARGSPALVANAVSQGHRIAQVAEDILAQELALRWLAMAKVSRLENRPDPHAWATAAAACSSDNLDLCVYATWRGAEALLENQALATRRRRCCEPRRTSRIGWAPGGWRARSPRSPVGRGSISPRTPTMLDAGLPSASGLTARRWRCCSSSGKVARTARSPAPSS